jgi:hypothetical protein
MYIRMKTVTRFGRLIRWSFLRPLAGSVCPLRMMRGGGRIVETLVNERAQGKKLSATEIINAELSEVERIIRNGRGSPAKGRTPADRHSLEVQQRVADILLNGCGKFENLVDHQ